MFIEENSTEYKIFILFGSNVWNIFLFAINGYKREVKVICIDRIFLKNPETP